MRIYKILLNLIVVVCLIITVYVFQTDNSNSGSSKFSHENGDLRLSTHKNELEVKQFSTSVKAEIERNKIRSGLVSKNFSNASVWCIFTKVKHKNSPLKYKFERFIYSMLKYSSIVITLNVISDNNSRIIAESVIRKVLSNTNKNFKILYHDVVIATESISNITAVMQPAFSPQRGGYYSDALFYISLGLYNLAEPDCIKAVMIDIDTEFKADIALLLKEYDHFSDKALLGLAPELSPVYQHVLYVYRSQHNNTKFGSPLSSGGFPGLNSGVILFHFDRIRTSSLYQSLLQQESVSRLIKKYSFMGHLGDQDMYTLVKMEYPDLIHILPCGWNRQLCKWWRDHGYPDVFSNFSHCNEEVKLYHGNCNTPIPRENYLNIN